MATTVKTKTQGRPTAKARKPSLSRAKKPTAKKVAQKAPIRKKKQAIKKQPAKRPVAAKPTVLEVSIPFGSQRTVKFSVVLSNRPAKKRSTKKRPTRKPARRIARKQRLSRQAQAHLSILMILLGVMGSLYFGRQVFADERPPITAQKQLVTPYAGQTPTPSLPASNAVRVQIPDIAVDTSVSGVGKEADGSLEVPKSYVNVGQYRLGPTPGELGPAVIVGHVDSYKGPAVFWRLRELKPGQKIIITREDGTKAKFRVNKIEEFAQDAFPTEKIYGNIDHAGLRLITCSGSFNPLKQRYSANTIVFASLMP